MSSPKYLLSMSQNPAWTEDVRRTVSDELFSMINTLKDMEIFIEKVNYKLGVATLVYRAQVFHKRRMQAFFASTMESIPCS